MARSYDVKEGEWASREIISIDPDDHWRCGRQWQTDGVVEDLRTLCYSNWIEMKQDMSKVWEGLGSSINVDDVNLVTR